MDTRKLRQKILDLAIRGKLVPQDPTDEPASVLLERIRAEKQRLVNEGKIKAPRGSKTSDTSPYGNVPFDLPEGWCWCKVEDIGEVITGNTPSKSVKEYYSGAIPFYKPTDLEQGLETLTASDTLSEFGFEQSRHLPKNSILVTCIGATIGKTGLIRQEGSCNQQINAILPNCPINSEYIYFVCVSDYFQDAIKSSASATTLPILNKNGFSKLLLPIPSAQEQNRIVRAVKNWLSIVEGIESNSCRIKAEITTAKSKILDLAISGKLVPQDPADEPAIELLKRINPAFKPCDNPHYEKDIPNSWCLARLGDVAEYGDTSSVNVDSIATNNWVLELEDIEKDTAAIMERKTKEKREISGVRHSFKKGQILYSKLRTYLNKVLIAPEDGFCTTEIMPISAGCAILPEYLLIVLRSPYFLEYTASLGYGVKMPRLGTNDAKRAVIPIPPYGEQGRIVQAVQKSMNKLDEILADL